MALPSSGQISMSQVNTELSLSSTAQISLNDAAVRTLFVKASGAISLNDGHGKSSQAPQPAYTNVLNYPFSYSDYTWTVPAGVYWCKVKSWGAGGTIGYGAYRGGGGGYSEAIYPVVPGQTVTTMVGHSAYDGYPGGVYHGGYSSGGYNKITNGTWVIWTGGGGCQADGNGGGGGGGNNAGGESGGQTGQYVGGDAQPGGGGNQPTSAGQDGEHDSQDNNAGAGGAGYHGGGGGQARADFDGYDNTYGAGGGGSGYISTGFYPGSTNCMNNTGTQAINTGDADYHSGTNGGGSQPGYVVIRY
jgi:hypothetical protein